MNEEHTMDLTDEIGQAEREQTDHLRDQSDGDDSGPIVGGNKRYQLTQDEIERVAEEAELSDEEVEAVIAALEKHNIYLYNDEDED